MPKIPPKAPALLTPKRMTFLTEEGTKLEGGYSGYTCSRYKRLYKLAEVKAEWGAFTKTEREQALAFIAANDTQFYQRLGYVFWFLTTYRNLDTGKTYRAIGCSVEEPGAGLRQLKQFLAVK